ncbi:MAG: CotH kinase family protein, partial [Bacteroidaceae bacterium]|nr:CotH kinase family protein [Bacteroidaceae bacterium]
MNEIMASNIDMMLDPSYNYGGWIELYNPTSSAISLNGLYISWDKDNLKKVAIPSGNGSVPAQGFKTLWFDHYDTGNEYSNNAKNQIDFKIDVEGDTLYISDRNGNKLIEQICPQAIARCSYARTTDGGDEWGYTYTPTQGKTNAGSIFAKEQLEIPVVDLTGTVYTTDFDIHVEIPEGATLRYTTDGTTPDLENGSTSESGVFHIGEQKNYVYRFRLYKDGYLPSDVATHSYIYNSSNYYLPVVSIVTNPDNLYDNKIGVLVDGTNGTTDSGGYRFVHGKEGTSNKNRGWERPVNFELIVPNSEKEYSVALNQGVDLEVSGGWSRHFSPSPSFKLKAGKLYGAKYFSYPIFSQKPYIRNKAIIVRNGGNDCECRIVDAAINEILSSSGFYIDCQVYQPTHVFINGKYQFMFNLRETTNKNYAYSNYGIDTDEVDQIEYSGGYSLKDGDDITYKKLTNLCNDLSSNSTDDDIWKKICDLCDIDELCNYFATELYVGSEDWVTNNNNTKLFRDRNDGKFHFVFFDVDEAFKRNDLFTKF